MFIHRARNLQLGWDCRHGDIHILLPCSRDLRGNVPLLPVSGWMAPPGPCRPWATHCSLCLRGESWSEAGPSFAGISAESNRGDEPSIRRHLTASVRHTVNMCPLQVRVCKYTIDTLQQNKTHRKTTHHVASLAAWRKKEKLK